MKRVLYFLLFSIAAFGCSAGEVDFSRFAGSNFWAAGGKAGVAPEGDGLLVSWDPAVRRFMEFTFPVAQPLGTFQIATVTVKLKRSAQSTFSALSLRLMDRDGEIFQFRAAAGEGVEELNYRIDGNDTARAASWKSSAEATMNRKLDFPVKLLGFAVDYPAGSAPGEVRISSMTYEKFPEEREPIQVKEGVAVPGKVFSVGREGDVRVFEYAEGVNFPVLNGGQFRLRLKCSGGNPQAILLLEHGKQEKPLKAATVKPDGKDGVTLIYPVPYELDTMPVSLRKICVESGEDVQLVELAYEIPHVKLDFLFGAGSPVNVWQQGTPGKYRIASSGREALSGKAELIWSDLAGRELDHRIETLSLAPGEACEFPLPEPERFGLYRLSGTLPGAGGRPVYFSRRVGYMPPNETTEHDKMQYGVVLLTPALPRLELCALAARLCGADFDRSSIIWMYIERHEGKWDWSYPDAHSRILKKNHLRWAPILWCPPRWATSKSWKPSYEPILPTFGFPLPDYRLWEEYVRNSVERYGRDNIRVMEVWNEAELPGFANFTPEEYAELLKRAYDVIKSVNPEIKVAICGFTCLPGQHPKMTFPDFMPRALRAARGKYDLHPIHLHGFFHEYAGGIRDFLRLRREWNITVPWAANETAITSSFCSRQVQAEVLFEKMVFSQANGAVAHVWHNMYDLGRDPYNKEHNFGLLDHALEPKEAYLAFNNVTRLFRGAELLRDLSFDECSVYLFRKGKQLLLPAWTLYPPVSERLLVLENVQGDVYQVDVFGNRAPVEVIDGKLLLPVTSSPATLVLEQRELPVVRGELFVPAGNTGEFRLAGKGVVRSVIGQPEGEEARELAVKDGVFRMEFDPGRLQKPLTLTLTFDTEFGKAAVRQFITPRFTLRARTGFDRPADFERCDGSSFQQTSPNDPMYAECIWKGREDCSVKLWLGWKSPDRIVIRAVVRDDIHFQDQNGTLIYQGDGLQFFFSRTATGGMWKFGVARDNQGNVRKFCWLNPAQCDGPALLNQIAAAVSRDEQKKETVYDLEVPADTLGIVRGVPFRFNLLVNDNDGRCREGYHALTEILDDGRNDNGYPVVLFED